MLVILFIFINGCITQPPPPNDSCETAEEIETPAFFIEGTRMDCQPEPLTCGFNPIGENNVWYRFNSDSYTQVIITGKSEYGGSENANFYLLSGGCGFKFCLASGDEDRDIYYTLGPVADEYLILVSDKQGIPDFSSFKLFFQLTNGDECGNAVELQNGGAVDSVLYNAVLDTVDGMCGSLHSIHGNTWFYFETGEENIVQLSMCDDYNNNFIDSMLFLYKGNDCGSLGPCLAADDDSCGSSYSKVKAIVLPGTKYYVSVTTFDEDNGPFRLNMTLSIGPNQLNNDCLSAEFLTSGTITEGNNIRATADWPDDGCSVSVSGVNVWYKFSTDETPGVSRIVISFCPAYGGLTTLTDIQIVLVDGNCYFGTCEELTWNGDCLNFPEITKVLGPSSHFYLSIGAVDEGFFSFYFGLEAGEDSCSSATVISSRGYYSGSTISASADEIASCSLFTQGNNLWYSFVPTRTFVIISTCPDFGGLVYQDPVFIFLYEGDCSTNTCVACSQEVYCGTNGAQITTNIEQTAPSYLFSIASPVLSSGSTFTFYFSLDNFVNYPENDFCEYAFEPTLGFNVGTMSGATPGSASGVCGGDDDHSFDTNVWYRFDSEMNGYASFQMHWATGFDPLITVYYSQEGTCEEKNCVGEVLKYSMLEIELMEETIYYFFVGTTSESPSSYADFKFEFQICEDEDFDGDTIVDCKDDCPFCVNQYFSIVESCTDILGGYSVPVIQDSSFVATVAEYSTAVVGGSEGCPLYLGGQCGNDFYFPFQCTNASLCVIEFSTPYVDLTQFAFQIATQSIDDFSSQDVELTFYDESHSELQTLTIDRSATPCNVASRFILEQDQRPLHYLKVSVIGRWGLNLISYSLDECSSCDDGDECTVNGEFCIGDTTCVGESFCPIPDLPTLWGTGPPTGIETGRLQITNDRDTLYLIWTQASNIWTAKRFYAYVNLDNNQPEWVPVQKYPYVANVGRRVTSVEIQIPFYVSCDYFSTARVRFYYEAVRASDGRSFASYMISDNIQYYDYVLCCCEGLSHLDGVIGSSEETFEFPRVNGY